MRLKMIKVTNTSDSAIDIHGTVCRPDAPVMVTDRQWRVFKASPMGLHWIGTGVVTGENTVKPSPSLKPETKAKVAKDAEPIAFRDDKG